MDILSNLSIVIPSHNEKRIYEMVDLTKTCFPLAEIIVSHDPFGWGKGWAVREGIRRSTKDYIVIINGDLDIHPFEIKKLISAAKVYDIVVGIKDTIYIPWNRKIITYLSRLLIKYLFKLPVRDTQTGLKLFPRKAITDYQSDGFIFDVELLWNAYKQGFTIGEVPVFCVSSKSKGLICLIKTLIETIKLRLRL